MPDRWPPPLRPEEQYHPRHGLAHFVTLCPLCMARLTEAMDKLDRLDAAGAIPAGARRRSTQWE